MFRSRVIVMVVLALGMVGAVSTLIMAQDSGESFGSVAQQQLRARMLQGLADPMGVTPAEWQTLLPKIDRVFVLRFRSRSGGGEGIRGATDADPGPPVPIAMASRELRRAVDNKDSTLDEIKAKLQTLRDEKAKNNTELEAARAELKAQLNIRQEAVLVLDGLLE